MLPAGMWCLVGALEAAEALRQQQRGVRPAPSAPTVGRSLSARLVMLPWFPAGVAALAEAALLNRLLSSQKWDKFRLLAGIAVTGAGVGLRQWAIRSLGPYFVCRVVVQPDQTVVSSGPYRWLRHPSYTGIALVLLGFAFGSGDVLSVPVTLVLTGLGLFVRIRAEEKQLVTALGSQYQDFAAHHKRLIPGVL